MASDKVKEFWESWDKMDDPLDQDLSGFVAQADWKWARLKLRKDKTVTLRMESALLDSTKALAKEEGVGYQGLMREFILEGIARRKKGSLIAAESLKMSYPKTRKKKKA